MSRNSSAKPRARGWIHVYAAIVAAIAGQHWCRCLVVESTGAGIATLIYTLTIVAMFCGQRHLSPREVEVGNRAQVDEAARPTR